VHDAVIVRTDPKDAPWLESRVKDLVQLLAGTLSHLRVDCTDIGPGTREVIFTEDLAATVRSLGSQIVDYEDLQGFDVSRLGGVVVGKTMFRNEDFSDAVLVMDSAVFRGLDDINRIGEIFLLSHELAHALIGQLRRASGNPRMEASWLPWEAGRWLSRYALEEYQADRIAQVVLGAIGTVTVDAETRPFRSTDFKTGRDQWVRAAAASTAAIANLIHAYRLEEIDLTAMWARVQALATDILITLAHAQAEADESDGNAPIVTEVVATEIPPAHRLWSSFTEIARGWQVLQHAAAFHVEEEWVLDRGRDALLEFWKDMGLTFRPEGDSFFLTVAAPQLAWKPS
jgi:hypothetical protein